MHAVQAGWRDNESLPLLRLLPLQSHDWNGRRSVLLKSEIALCSARDFPQWSRKQWCSWYIQHFPPTIPQCTVSYLWMRRLQAWNTTPESNEAKWWFISVWNQFTAHCGVWCWVHIVGHSLVEITRQRFCCDEWVEGMKNKIKKLELSP